ncbi:MAG: hypothetical protein ACOYPS_00150 [Phycisphaerales bacterium]
MIDACNARVGLASGPGEAAFGREVWREPQARLVVLSFFPWRRWAPSAHRPSVPVPATRLDIQTLDIQTLDIQIFDIQTSSAGMQAEKVRSR